MPVLPALPFAEDQQHLPCGLHIQLPVSISFARCLFHGTHLACQLQLGSHAEIAICVTHFAYAMQVGMRYFHLNKNKYHCPIINLDKIWNLVGEEVRPSACHQCFLHTRLEMRLCSCCLCCSITMHESLPVLAIPTSLVC